MKKLLTFILTCLLCKAALSQNYPVYNQYFNNPSLINPAFVGHSGYTEVGVTHRRQWVGIEGAPVLTSLNVQYPTKKSVALGLSLTSSSMVYETRTSVQATFAYRVLLGDQHHIKFGLSGGAGNYHLDANKIDDESLNDPAVQKLIGSHYFFDGQFGVSYTYKGLNLGFAVPRLFDSRTLKNSAFKDVSYAELKFNLISASYRFNLGGSGIAFEPYVLYRMGNDIKEKWEGLGTVYIKNLVWFGGSYRQQYGPTVFGGIRIKNLKFGYAYEIPNSPIAGLSKGSHEIQLNIRFGQDRSPKTKTKSSPYKKPTPAEKPKEVKKEEKKEEPKESKATTPKDQVIQPDTNKQVEDKTVTTPETKAVSKAQPEEIKTEAPGSEVKIEEKKSSHPLELKKTNYLVVGVFKFVKNAEAYKKQLKEKGYVTFIGYSSKSQSFYVYLSKYDEIEDAREERTAVRELELFGSAWIMSVE